MNGATAVPSVRTSNAPNNNNTRIIGNSQNFFRSRMNAQRSARNDPMCFSSRFYFLFNVTRPWKFVNSAMPRVHAQAPDRSSTRPTGVLPGSNEYRSDNRDYSEAAHLR